MEEYLKFEREADRLEVLIIRPIYSLIIGIVLWVYGLIAGICLTIQWWVVLITGERNEGLNDPIRNLIEYALEVAPYVCNLTDEHPELSHKRIKIYLEGFEYGNNRGEYLKFEREADRLEVLIIRPIYSLIIGIVLWVYELIACICMAIQWVVVLITGERNDSLNDSIRQVIEYALQVAPYVYNLTDEHPELTLNRMKIFIERFD